MGALRIRLVVQRNYSCLFHYSVADPVNHRIPLLLHYYQAIRASAHRAPMIKSVPQTNCTTNRAPDRLITNSMCKEFEYYFICGHHTGLPNQISPVQRNRCRAVRLSQNLKDSCPDRPLIRRMVKGYCHNSENCQKVAFRHLGWVCHACEQRNEAGQDSCTSCNHSSCAACEVRIWPTGDEWVSLRGHEWSGTTHPHARVIPHHRRRQDAESGPSERDEAT